MTGPRKVGVAIIGCGEISKYHIEALRMVPQAEIRVCCDILPERAWAASAGYAYVTTDYEQAIAHEGVDLVFVLTPNYLHMPIAVCAAQHGKHVFVQKPFARTVQECEAIIAAARQNHVKVFASFMHRYFEETQWARRYIAEGGLGEIYMAHIRNSLPGSDYSTWQYEAARCGQGGAIVDVGVHGIDIVRYLLGDIDQVLCASKGQKLATRVINGQTIHPDNEDWALATYRLKSGAVVSHQISWIQKWHCNRYTMEIHGSKGSLYLRTGYGPLAVTSPGVSAPGNLVYPALPAAHFGYRQHQEVISSVLQDTPVFCPGEDGLYTLQVVQKILTVAHS